MFARLWNGDPDATAAAICADLRLNTRQRSVLFAAIRHEVVRNWRLGVRAVEREAFARPRREAADSGERSPVLSGLSISDLNALVGQSFRLERSGPLVTWEAATVADHKVRIDALRRLRAGVDATIERHVFVVRACERAGVNTLAELLALPLGDAA